MEQFIDVWTEAYERMTLRHEGTYSIELRNLKTGDLLLAYDNLNINLGRAGADLSGPSEASTEA